MKTLRQQWRFNGRFVHNGLTYCKGINDVSAQTVLNEVEPIKVGDRVYVWDPHKHWIASRDRPRGGDYQGGRAYGTVVSVNENKAMIQYDDYDLAELIEEQIKDLGVET